MTQQIKKGARMDKLEEDWKMIDADDINLKTWNACLPVFSLIESQQTDFSEIVSLR